MKNITKQSLLDYVKLNNCIPNDLIDDSNCLVMIIEEYLNNKLYIDIISSFSANAWTDEIINKYFRQLIRKSNYLPTNCLNNGLMLKIAIEECLDNDFTFKFLNNFPLAVWTDEIINLYGKKLLLKFKQLPYYLYENNIMLEICIKLSKEHNEYKRIITFFNDVAWNMELFDKYGLNIIKEDPKIIFIISKNEKILEKCIIFCLNHEVDFNILDYISYEGWTIYIINMYIEKLFNKYKTVPYYGKKNILIIKKALQYAKKNNCYEIFDDFFNFFSLNYNEKKSICDRFGQLLLINDDILYTLNPEILKLNLELNIYELLQLSNDKDVQEKILIFNNKTLIIFNKIMHFLRKSKLDITPIVKKCIENINKYSSFIDRIDLITDEQLNNFILILQDSSNTIELKLITDLDSSKLLNKLNLIKIKSDECSKYIGAILNKKYGICYDLGNFIFRRYCSITNIYYIINNLNKLNPTLEFLIDIYYIFTSDINKLKNIFNTCSFVESLDRLFYIEPYLRGYFASMYDNSLYKLNDKDLNNFSYVKNPLVLDKLKILSKKYKIYYLSKDFNMLVHSINAFFGFFDYEIKNYKDEWNISTTYDHGICTSYVGNDLIAIAPSPYPTLGFAVLKPKELLLLGPYDLYSDNKSYSITLDKISMFLFPTELINNTRLKYNELVKERMDECIKVQPDYIVYVIDDVNNIINFLTLEEYNNSDVLKNSDNLQLVLKFERVLQCSEDMNLPIVIVDRCYFANYEKNKCDMLLEQFKNSLNIKIFKELFVKIFNNLVGGFNDIINKKQFLEYLKEIIIFIKSSDCDKEILLNELVNILKDELDKESKHIQYGEDTLMIEDLNEYISLIGEMIANMKEDKLKIKQLKYKNS